MTHTSIQIHINIHELCVCTRACECVYVNVNESVQKCAQVYWYIMAMYCDAVEGEGYTFERNFI